MWILEQWYCCGESIFLSLSGSDPFFASSPHFLLWETLLRGFFSYVVKSSSASSSLLVCPLRVQDRDPSLGSPFSLRRSFMVRMGNHAFQSAHQVSSVSGRLIASRFFQSRGFGE